MAEGRGVDFKVGVDGGIGSRQAVHVVVLDGDVLVVLVD